MREIKFRAWDKQDNNLIRNLYVSWGNYAGDFYEYLYDDNFVVMQYTGMKDKNGVEIFEGDLVRGRIYHMHAEDNVIFQIRWADQDKGYGMHWYPNEVEVIGNIFENSELLEVQS